VFNFMLPGGTVLTTDDAPSQAKGGRKNGKSKRREALVDTDVHRDADSLDGLGGYHGSIITGGDKIYYAIGVLSEVLDDGSENGIIAFQDSWKNIVATFYHELCEARTDPDVEEANNTGRSSLIGWTSRQGEEIGDFPIAQDPGLNRVFLELPLANGHGTVPIQLPYSNRVQGPEDPTKP
jgi:hypothetical protein